MGVFLIVSIASFSHDALGGKKTKQLPAVWNLEIVNYDLFPFVIDHQVVLWQHRVFWNSACSLSEHYLHFIVQSFHLSPSNCHGNFHLYINLLYQKYDITLNGCAILISFRNFTGEQEAE